MPSLDPLSIPGILPAATVSAHQQNEYLEVVAEAAARNAESLKLYEPSDFQEDFHKCTAKEVLLQAGNQAGKSLAAFVEIARAVTGQDPYNKYPTENGVCVCVGFKEDHINLVIHKYLFRRGAFKIIRDHITGNWRTYRPWDAGDVARKKEARLAPPLIPKRFIKKIAWVKKSKNIFDYVELHNGWIIYGRSSKAEPIQGNQVDLVLIDEDLEREDWYTELIARLSMTNGKLRWSALPHAKNNALINVVDRAEDEKAAYEKAIDEGKPEEAIPPSTVVIRASVYHNKYMPKESRDENIKRWKAISEDEYRKRALGELITDSFLMYPTFSESVHEAMKKDETSTKVQQILHERNGMPPNDWTRYMIVDPGHTICAVGFFAVPPPDIGDQIVMYDELYMQRCDPNMFGKQVYAKINNWTFQEFLIDAHGGKLSMVGSEMSAKRQYEMQLEKYKQRSVSTGGIFRAASDDIEGRVMKLREWLSVRADGTTKFLINTRDCPNTCKEFRRFKKKIVRDARGGQDVASEDGDRRRFSHAVECCEYMAAHGAAYKKPPDNRVANSYVARILQGRKMRRLQRLAAKLGFDGSGGYVNLGPQGTQE
jgi:hypothetical protein